MKVERKDIGSVCARALEHMGVEDPTPILKLLMIYDGIALDFLAFYKRLSLYSVFSERTMRHWMENHNEALQSVPYDLLYSIDGIRELSKFDDFFTKG